MKSDAYAVLSIRLPKKLLKDFDRAAATVNRPRPDQIRKLMADFVSNTTDDQTRRQSR